MTPAFLHAHPLIISLRCHVQVGTAHVIPDDIDLVRFNNALARTLSVYPLCAGRLVRPDAIDQPWKVCSSIFYAGLFYSSPLLPVDPPHTLWYSSPSN